MEKGINHERLRLLIIAVAIVAVSSIAIIETEPRVSAHTDQPLVPRGTILCHIPNLSCNNGLFIGNR